MASPIAVFSPVWPTASLDADSTTDRVELPKPQSGETRNVRVHNAGLVPAFLRFGDAAVTATLVAGMPVAAGNTEMFEIGAGVSHCAALTASGTAMVYFTIGSGA